MSITDLAVNAARWRPHVGRHRRARLFGITAAALIGSAALASRGSPTTTIALESGTALDVGEVYLNNTYNYWVEVKLDGPDPVHIVAARLRDPSPGLVTREPLVAWKCGGLDSPAVDIPGDDLRNRPGVRAWLASERPITQAEAPCPFLYLRVVPTRKGILQWSGFDVDYQVGTRIRTIRLDYQITLHVNREGIDDLTR